MVFMRIWNFEKPDKITLTIKNSYTNLHKRQKIYIHLLYFYLYLQYTLCIMYKTYTKTFLLEISTIFSAPSYCGTFKINRKLAVPGTQSSLLLSGTFLMRDESAVLLVCNRTTTKGWLSMRAFKDSCIALNLCQVP